jgi:flagellar basal-body rod protein FlgG
MIKGIFNTAASMVPRERKQEVIANNLANAETVGFKKDSVFLRMFRDSAPKDAASSGNRQAPSWEVRMIDKVYTSFIPGSLDRTGRDLDVALQGDGFFVVQTPDGEAYTRNGAFTLAADGTLVNSDNMPVMTTSGAVSLQGGQVAIGVDGQISVDSAVVANLRVVDFDDPNQLLKLGDGLFVAGQGVQPIALTNPEVRQGYLERSNVDVLREMVDMIETYRGFEMGQKMIQIQDESLGKAVNELGKA